MTKQMETLKRLAAFSVPELCDGMVEFKTMDHRLKPMVTQQKIVGYALTVQIPVGDSALVTKAIEQSGPGDVIVIDYHGCCESACWGDHRSFCANFQKAEGVVIDGAFRDLDGCEEVGFPVYARAVTPGAAGKGGCGAVNLPIRCGGVVVNPGDIIVGDRNGVLVLPPETADAVVAGAQKKIAAQKWTVAEMLRTGQVMPRIELEKGTDEHDGHANDSAEERRQSNGEHSDCPGEIRGTDTE